MIDRGDLSDEEWRIAVDIAFRELEYGVEPTAAYEHDDTYDIDDDRQDLIQAKAKELFKEAETIFRQTYLGSSST